MRLATIKLNNKEVAGIVAGKGKRGGVVPGSQETAVENEKLDYLWKACE